MLDDLADECVCGQCLPCRRSAREMDRPRAVTPPPVLSEVARRILDEGAYFEPTRGPRPPRRAPQVTAGDKSRRQVLAEERKAQRVLTGDHWIHPSPGSPHGTPGAYRHWFCRCAKCRAYGAAAAQAMRDRRKVQKALRG